MTDVLREIEAALRSDSDARRDEALDASYVEIERLRKQVEIALSALKHIRDISASVSSPRESANE